MIPAVQSDVWRKASETEKIQALVTLSGLPSRETTAGELDNAAFMTALEGVTRHGLSEAVKFILRGALGHAFLPSPPELRLQCDKAMEWHERERQRIARQERLETERLEHIPRGEPSPEAKARVSAIYARFCAGYETTKAEETLKLDPALVAQIPDNPKSLARTKMGKAA